MRSYSLVGRAFPGLFFALIILAAFPATSHAISIDGTGINGLAAFTGTFDYTQIDSTSATLDVILTNTTPAGGGFLTAFVFNNPNNLITGVSLTSSSISPISGTFDFDTVLFSNNNVNGAPFGRFDIGLTTSDNANANNGFGGGGNPNQGIGVGATGMFSFALTGTSLDTLDEASFVSALSVPPGSGEGVQFFAARFRGIEIYNKGKKEEKSDKAPGRVAVPEPTSLLLLGSGLVGLGLWRRLRS